MLLYREVDNLHREARISHHSEKLPPMSATCATRPVWIVRGFPSVSREAYNVARAPGRQVGRSRVADRVRDGRGAVIRGPSDRDVVLLITVNSICIIVDKFIIGSIKICHTDCYK